MHKEPYDVEWWSITLTPHMDKLAVVTKYKRAGCSLLVNMEESIIYIVPTAGNWICVMCIVDDHNQEDNIDEDYRFSYMISGLIL